MRPIVIQSEQGTLAQIWIFYLDRQGKKTNKSFKLQFETEGYTHATGLYDRVQRDLPETRE